MTAPFPARFPGTCDACDLPIRPGDTVTYAGQDLVHEDCAADVITGRHASEPAICPTCHMARPCWCEGGDAA